MLTAFVPGSIASHLSEMALFHELKSIVTSIIRVLMSPSLNNAHSVQYFCVDSTSYISALRPVA